MRNNKQRKPKGPVFTTSKWRLGVFLPYFVKFSCHTHKYACKNLPRLAGKSLTHPPFSAMNTGSKSVQAPTENQNPFNMEIVNRLNKINDNLESVNRRLDNSSKMRSFSGKNFVQSVLIAVIATVLSSIVISITSNIFEQNNYKRSIFNAVENISIGCSKEWMDSKFGVPTFSCAHPLPWEEELLSEDLSIVEYCYILDELIIRAFYKSPVESCCLFLVTQRTEKISQEVNIPYSPTNGKSLGKFTYYEIEGKPLSVFGFDYQGFVRDLYGEFYYLGTSKSYYNFVFMTLDYGYVDSNFFIGPPPFQALEFFLDDEVDINQIEGLPMCASRDSVHPNTYGISALSEQETIILVESYSSFDSFWYFYEGHLKST